MTAAPEAPIYDLDLFRAMTFLKKRGWTYADGEDGRGYFEPERPLGEWHSFDTCANAAVLLAHEVSTTFPTVTAWHRTGVDLWGDPWVDIVIRKRDTAA